MTSEVVNSVTELDVVEPIGVLSVVLFSRADVLQLVVCTELVGVLSVVLFPRADVLQLVVSADLDQLVVS